MSLNSFGEFFRLTTFGESHGELIGGVIDGCPPRLVIDQEHIAAQMQKRAPGTNPHVTQRKESDVVRIVSGMFNGQTTGAPLAFLIDNQNTRSQDYSEIKNLFRPGHADYVYQKKYGIRDYRGGGRSSARETAVRVAAGAIAQQWLKAAYGVEILACVAQIGEHSFMPNSEADWQASLHNEMFAPVSNAQRLDAVREYIQEIRRAKDSCGAKIVLRAKQVPVGWGQPVFDRLDAKLASAMMSINAVKAVEIGDGVVAAAMRGSEHNDGMDDSGYSTNHAGGIIGGISTGQPLSVQVTFKPTSSIAQSQSTVNQANQPTLIETKGRHDPCVGLRAVAIVEAMCALVLMDCALASRAYDEPYQGQAPVCEKY